MSRPRSTVVLLHALFVLSGGAGLGYEVVWSRMLATGLGHEMPAVLAVVTAFMGGMAMGAWALDRRISRSAKPGRWYAGLEFVIGAWSVVLTGLIPAFNEAAPRLIGLAPSPGHHWLIAFLAPFVILLPATVALGATFPAMERFLAPLALERRCVGGLYAANTFGAVAGILVCVHVLMPALGFRATTWLLAGVNILCGAAAWLLATRLSPVAAGPGGNRSTVHQSTKASLTRPRLLATVFLTGTLGIGYELLGIHVLAQVLENTIFTFAAVLSAYLLGTAAGAALYQRYGRGRPPVRLLTHLLIGLSLTCSLGILLLGRMKWIYDACRAALGDAQGSVLLAELAVAMLVFGLPTLFMGATFSHLVQSARRPQGGVGQALACNTLGAALAGAVVGICLLPLLGAGWGLALIALAYLGLVPTWRNGRWRWALAAILAILVLPKSLRIVNIPPGATLIAYREGVMGSVAVIEEENGHRSLRVDNHFQMGGTAAAATEYRHAHLPLLLHPAPQRMLVLGAGTGITLGAGSLHPGLQSDGVELVPEVVEMMDMFAPYNFHQRMRLPSDRLPPEGSRAALPLAVHVADARRFVRASDVHYDVIVADLFHPARDGAGLLYTREHFGAIRERLADGGLFCQWLPLFQIDEATLRTIARTFLEVFPEAEAWLLHYNVETPVVGLIGRLQTAAYSSGWVEDRLTTPELEEHLKRLAWADSVRVFGNLLAGPKDLREFAGSAPLNTDDLPHVIWMAARFIYERHANPHGRLAALMVMPDPSPESVLGVEGRFAVRLRKYFQARDAYLAGLIDQAEGRDSQAVDAFVRSARLSDDFTAGYAQCLTMASLWAREDPAKARALLDRLIEAQPARAVAAEMRKRLFGE